MTTLSIDFETRATVDLRKTGVYPYAEHPDTGIWCMAWAFDDDEPAVWFPHDVSLVLNASGATHAFPLRVLEHVEQGGEIRAHNAEFERIIWREIMHKRWGFPNPALEQWVCSAAEAAAMALPRSLDQACQVTGVRAQKDADGYALMMRMTRPRKIHPDGRIEWWDVPERIHRLAEYCKQDVRAEKALSKVLRRLTPLEREHYLETCRQNDRGIQVDTALVIAAKEVADEGVARANAALEQLTGGEVSAVTNHTRLKNWINEQGVETDSVSKKAVRELLESDLDPAVREVLQLRADAGRSSIAKLDSLLECACADGKIRGMHLYHGASTGRETGRLVQVHNFPRPDVGNAESFVDAILRRAYEEIDLFHHPVAVVSSLLRGMLTASPGHRLLRADYAAIEARVLNVLAGQDDIVALFAAGEDVYSYNAARLPGAVQYVRGQKHPWRQMGKFQELGCGFGMGAAKAVSAAKDVYGLTLTEDEARAIVRGYRETHPRVVDFWKATEQAALQAVREPGTIQTFGALQNLKCTQAGAYLYLILPARRPLVYAAPRIVEREVPWSTEEQPEFRPAVEISAVDGFTKKWRRVALYGGLLVENIVQAVSRDLLLEAKLRLETAGYPVVLSVHDELVADVLEGHGSLEEFVRLMEECPAWAAGWPIKAEGVESFRYGK